MSRIRRLPLIAAVLAAQMMQAHGQSSANFQIEGGLLSSTSSTGTPVSAGFRAEGGIGANAISGIAGSANFVASSGLPAGAPQLTERIFANGFEN